MKKLVKHGLKKAGYRLERVRPPLGVKVPSPASRQLPLLTDVDVRFHVGDWRYRVPSTLMVGRPCFGYGPNSWHPFVETVSQLLENPQLDYEASALNSHYATWKPTTIAEAHFPGRTASDPVLSEIPAHTLFEPWLLQAPPCDNPLNPECRPSGAPLYGPVERQRGHEEFMRLQLMIESFDRYGYNPDDFPRGLITGIVLEHEGQQRFLVVHGQHRTSVLSAQGHQEIEVGIRGDGPFVINSSQAEIWPHVRSGLVSREVAVDELARYFQVDDSDGPAFSVRQLIESRGRGS